MAALPPSNPQSQVNSSIQQQQLNNFLGPVNGALGGLPVAEKNQSYFVVFQGAGGTGPEIIDQTALFVTYLVNENGNVSKPSEDYDSLNNLIQNFEVGKNVVVRNDAPTALNGNIAGNHLITAVGRQQPILYTQTGSSAGANVTTLTFGGYLNQVIIPNMEGVMTIQNPSISLSPTTITGWTAPVAPLPDPAAAVFDETTGKYTVVSSGVGDTQDITFNVAAKFVNNLGPDEFENGNINVNITLYENTTPIGGISYTVQPGETLVTGNLPVSATRTIGVLTNPVYTIKMYASYITSFEVKWVQFQVTNQNPEPTPYQVTDFWNNNNYNNLWLTASSELSANYGRIPSPVQECLDFNFSPIETPFNVQVGDRIRFEYNPNTEYFIYEVIEPIDDNEGLLRLKLNTLIPDSVNLDNFVLHRVNTNDPAYVILDVIKNNLVGNTQNFNGVVLPEYPTKRLKDNLDNIIIDLKSRGIITDNEN